MWDDSLSESYLSWGKLYRESKTAEYSAHGSSLNGILEEERNRMNTKEHSPAHGREYTLDELNARMKDYDVDPRVREYLNRCIAFHSFPAPGLLIGAFMVDYALEQLGARPDEKLYAVCETHKCAPDALQVIAHATYGNNRLRIVNVGKFAITVNRASAGDSSDGVRVYVDPKKLSRYPTIQTWFTNSPGFDKKTMNNQLFDEIFAAGRAILSSERVRVKVEGKKKWKAVTCPKCGEMVPDYSVGADGLCAACGNMRYYEKID
ncbi:FmdE family protein [Methanoregula sp.]|uniref:FmdE family protein n=1 Tax=Methanoregula sp. TaxID=2052170 RepID=UPI003C72D2AC